MQVVATKEEWDELMSKPDVTYIIDFTATCESEFMILNQERNTMQTCSCHPIHQYAGCGPCRMIGPVFEALSPNYSTIVFLKVDVDENAKVAEECGISAMPTFQVFKNGSKIDEMVGASKDKLEALVEKHK